MRMTARGERGKMIRVTAWIPRKKLKALMKERRGRFSQSEVLRFLVDNELERIRSWKAHEGLYGVAKGGDFDDRLL